MKNFRKIVSLGICAVIVLGLTACGQNDPGSADAGTTTSNTLDDDERNPVDINEFVSNEETDTLENPDLLYFSHYDMRVAGDIKPGVKLFEETYGGKIDYMQVGWGERMDKLQTLISTGQSPDLIDKDDLSFPYLMSQNVYQDMTSYFEKYMDEEQWTSAYKELIERYSWKGAHYFYPFTVNALPNCLIYDADRFESLGLDNPKELYLNDQWDWNAFKKSMIDFMTNNPDALGGIQGLVSENIFLSTGVPLIAISDGNVVSNISNESIDRAANFLMDIRKQGLPVRGDGMWSNEPEPLASGKVAFLGVGQWKITDFCKDYPDQKFEFVPFPRDPLADDYYYGLSAFSYMVCSGAPNPEGSAAFINIMRKCQVDPELREVVNQSILADKQYDRETFDYLLSFENIDNFSLTLEGYSGFSSDLTNIMNDMMTNIAFEQGEEQKGWTQLRTENEGAINSYLEPYTK
ncbi:MAG: extracellular solute-binding protein [Eubacterium sp.]|nr:extracellular solute-binding protein [Eubacterium sp.]